MVPWWLVWLMCCGCMVFGFMMAAVFAAAKGHGDKA